MNKLSAALLVLLPLGTVAQAEEPSFKGRTLTQLTEDLQSDKAMERLRGAFGLGQLEEAAAPATMSLCSLLADPQEDVRECAASAIGLIGPKAKEAVPSLIDALRPCLDLPLDEDWEGLYRQVAKSLGQIGPDAADAIPLLYEIVNAEDEEDSLWLVRASASKGLVGIGAPALEFLLLRLKEEEGEYRSNVISLLADFGERAKAALPGLIADLRSEDVRTREVAAFYIGQIGGSAVIPQLIDAVEDDEFDVYIAAARSLSELGLPAIKALVELLGTERAMTGSFTLGWIAENSAADVALEREVEDYMTRVREICARAVPRLLATPEDDSAAKREATLALGRIGGSAANWVTTEEEVSAQDRATFAKARDQILDGVLTSLGTKDERMFDMTVNALYLIGDTATARLEELASEEGPTQTAARTALDVIEAWRAEEEDE